MKTKLMENIEFWKMSGSGNDFILIDNRENKISEAEMSHLVKMACRRRESVGADGMIFIGPSRSCDFAWKFFNADGGEVELCGNGGRCAARFALLKGIAGPEMTFETLAGPIQALVKERRVKLQMPDPKDLQQDIDLPLETGGMVVDFVNTGVPHIIVYTEDLDSYPVAEQGKAIRYHRFYAPEGTNANFMRVLSRDRIELRTYERGVEDETLACGTGAIAASVAASARNLVHSPVRVKTWGGEELVIHFQTDKGVYDHVWLEGNTSIIYKAQLCREAL